LLNDAVKGQLRVLAVVPARGGTDRVPYLNVKRLGDRPLLAHTLEAARQSPSIDRVIVSTDDAYVAEVAQAWGAEAPFLRPAELAADIPSLKPVIVHAVLQAEADGDRADLVVVLQATTPFREAAVIEEAVERLVTGGFDTVVSVSEDRALTWKADRERLVPLFAREGRREEQEPIYRENGAVVAMRRAVLDQPSRFGEKVGYLALDKRSGFTVHDLEDFWMAERLLREPRVLFRVDGSGSLGMGHVYRSLAVADALKRISRAEIAFLMSADHTEGVVAASRYGYPVRVGSGKRLEDYLEHIRDFAPTVLINDLPAIPADYLRALSHLGAPTINLVDTLGDLESTEHYAQVIVSVVGEEGETPESFYGGPAYAILREHFAGRQKEIRDEPQMVLLTFGGSDAQALTLRAARALQGLPPGIEVLAVAGPAFSYRREFEELQQTLARKVPIINEAGGHIAELMLEADVVVGSGGMSVYEIAALGTPGVILGQNAREERRMREFARHGTVEYLGLGSEVEEGDVLRAVETLLFDPERRREMSARGRALVDGLGAARTAEMVMERRKRER
jgi:spore coat polysaccharide biosynthesis predicted glycosyltransferase SpsG/spore coat polysaccharide biosynthesis protein SpsF (cytidylyltransferase family)